MNIEKMREEFEAAEHKRAELAGRTWESHAFKRSSSTGDYLNPSIAHGWWAWQASRESLVIELPVENPLGSGPGDCEGGLPSFEQHCAAECNFILRDCRDAIHAAGVKTK